MSDSVTVVCLNNGTADREIHIGNEVYVVDAYQLDTLIEALKVIRDTADCVVKRSLKRKK